jgi:hypothetical protein
MCCTTKSESESKLLNISGTLFSIWLCWGKNTVKHALVDHLYLAIRSEAKHTMRWIVKSLWSETKHIMRWIVKYLWSEAKRTMRWIVKSLWSEAKHIMRWIVLNFHSTICQTLHQLIFGSSIQQVWICISQCSFMLNTCKLSKLVNIKKDF